MEVGFFFNVRGFASYISSSFNNRCVTHHGDVGEAINNLCNELFSLFVG